METQQKSSAFMNPLIRKLNDVKETDPSRAASYKGIAGKTCFFMLCAVAGIALFYMLRSTLEVGKTMTVEGYVVYPIEGLIAFGALLLSGIAPLLAFIVKPLTPILGSIYCVAFTYSMTWLANVFSEEYAHLVAAAVVVTILLVALMAILYATRVVKVNHKFRAVVTVLFFTMAGSGILFFLASLVPGLNAFIAPLRENAVLSLVVGAIYVVIACLFLLVDFDTIESTVQRQLPKKYEWIAAFGLAYTIFYLFLKVFHLLSTIKGQSNK